MATYQGDRLDHLKIAIQSILSQKYVEFELLIVCDGPVDSIRKEYLESLPDNTITINLLKNAGPSTARNAGIDAARGFYIAIMDSDDISMPCRLRQQLNFLIDNDLDLVSSDLSIINSNGDVTGIRRVPYRHADIRKMAAIRCPMHNPSAFGKARLFKELKYNTALSVSEDYDLWVRALLHGYRLGNISSSLVKYRQDKNSILKRVGFNYSKSDFLVKYLSLKLLPFYQRPFYLCIALISASIRLLPPSVFEIVYRWRSKPK